MYGIYAYIGVVWGVNVGIYSIHGVYGYVSITCRSDLFRLRNEEDHGAWTDVQALIATGQK